MELAQTVLTKIRRNFSDVLMFVHNPQYDVSLENFIREIIMRRIPPSYSQLDIFLDNNFDSYSSTEEKQLIRTMFFCALLELCFQTPESRIYKIDNLLLYYPEFNLSDRDSQLDLPRLLRFRNYMALAFAIQVPRKRIKSFLIPALGRLDDLSHVTGGSQRSCISKRLFIYYRESGQSIQNDALINWNPAHVEVVPPPIPKAFVPFTSEFTEEEIDDDISISSFPVPVHESEVDLNAFDDE
mmetsp:Transcript_10777/g.11625  ORF Transcript_10777/g.11625 Transcript_10777/m.11625 type:complete len:241 (-) Transcript_10777:102-824(-)